MRCIRPDRADSAALHQDEGPAAEQPLARELAAVLVDQRERIDRPVLQAAVDALLRVVVRAGNAESDAQHR
jgi:hypothetical protein